MFHSQLWYLDTAVAQCYRRLLDAAYFISKNHCYATGALKFCQGNTVFHLLHSKNLITVLMQFLDSLGCNRKMFPVNCFLSPQCRFFYFLMWRFGCIPGQINRFN